MERDGEVWVLRYRRRLAHPRDKVWRALTEDGHLAAWFPTTIEGERAAGASLHFSFREGEAEPFDGEMLAFDPPVILELRWADDVLRFDLTADGRVRTVAQRHLPRRRQGSAGRGRVARLPRTARLRV